MTVHFGTTKIRTFMAVVSVSALLASLGTASVAAAAHDPATGSAPAARAEASAAPKGVAFIFSGSGKKALKRGVPITIRYLGNLRSTSNKPTSFNLYAMNNTSKIFELQAVALPDCTQAPKRGARCTFNDLPDYWADVASETDRLGVAASNAAGEGPRAYAAGTWLAELDAVAECVEAAAEESKKKIQLALAGAIAGTMAGLVASAFTAGVATAPVLAVGGTAVVSATAALAVTGGLKDAATDFLEAVREGATEDILSKSGNKFIKALGKAGMKVFAAFGGALALAEVGDAGEQYFVSADACRG